MAADRTQPPATGVCLNAPPVPVIEVCNATVIRGGVAVLHDASWRVMPGEHWFVLGRNGCGKSTLMGVVMANLWPRIGSEVAVLGQRFGEVDTRELRKKIGWVGADLVHRTQDSAKPLNIVLSGFDASIGLYREPLAVEREQALAKLAELDIAGLADRDFGTLSAGEQMRVLIARATIHSPALLILDEPCSHLDLPSREEFLDFLHQLTLLPGAPAIVQVTHRLDDISELFSHGLVIRAGRVIAAGPRQTVLTDAVLSAAFGIPIHLHTVAGRSFAAVVRGERD